MRLLSVVGFCLLTAIVANAGDDVLTKDGKLAHPLKVKQLQGGFAGFTGIEYTLESDGTWSSATLFNQKSTPKDKGKLSPKELQAVIAILAKNELQKLPAKSGKQPGANPHTITLEYGKTKATLVGQTPPKVDPKDDQSVESRFASIFQAIRGTLKGADKKKPEGE